MAKLTFFQVKGAYGMWYVIQITTGKEEELIRVIDKMTEGVCYQDCFYIKRERVWRRGGDCIVHIEPMFPGYIFVSTDMPETLFEKLKQIPRFTRLLKSPENDFLSVAVEEQVFLENMVNGDKEYVVRLSEVEIDEEKNIVAVRGALEQYVQRIIKKKIRLRYVVVRVQLLGEERNVLIGIKVKR